MSNLGTLRSGVHSNVMATAGNEDGAVMAPVVYRVAVVVTLVLACWFGSVHRAGAADAVRVSETRPLMGVEWTLTVHAPTAPAGRQAIDAGFDEAVRLERILSDYDPGSELSRLSASSSAQTPVPLGDDLWHVLVRSKEICRQSHGAFDITVGPLTTLWRQSRRSGHLPRPDKLKRAMAAVGGDGIMLDPDRRTAQLTKPGMRLDLGGIGMGYAADRVLATLEGLGIPSAMVDASGDIVVSGAPPHAAGWRIRIAGLGPNGGKRHETIMLTHAAITTSGDANQAVEIDGKRYSHIVDPRTGLGVAGPAAVTVIAPDGATADALATAASVLGPEAGMEVVAQFPGCAARFLWKDGESEKARITGGWPNR